MKKTKEFTNVIVKKLINFLNQNFDKKDDLEITANSLMGIIFNERNTNDSIELIQLLKQKSDAELTKRKTLAILEKNSITDYFNPLDNVVVRKNDTALDIFKGIHDFDVELKKN